MEPWLAPDNRAALFGLRTDWLRRAEAMKTAGRENRKRYTSVVASRAPGTEGQNKPARRGRAGRQEKLRPQEKCFFLDSFYGTYQELAHRGEHQLVRIVAKPVAWATKPVRVRRRKRKHCLFDSLEFFDHTRWISSIARRKHIANDRRRQSCRFNRWM